MPSVLARGASNMSEHALIDKTKNQGRLWSLGRTLAEHCEFRNYEKN